MDTDVLVIGGGISGCALAYFLAKEGVEVSLVEKSGLNSEASGANSGSLHGQIPHDVFLEKGEAIVVPFPRSKCGDNLEAGGNDRRDTKSKELEGITLGYFAGLHHGSVEQSDIVVGINLIASSK